ncbi:MFS transporter [Marinagarivorans cellulosilyticus]|uniref:Glycoside/pentoside/hexuronide:cation symporter, GPH family n=1 Tax=Marinagarivorans cellulosilyticus TaxID=2721545 RepID=A0AAN1WL10_9GAMM|nr:MFS transporter [Marinagarivorans cellulosilyticus]BCD99606.1 glycoside/pentoside/hexuronide:cation symporter, GPH family [Marinagarivorans cellulosilyticus]
MTMESSNKLSFVEKSGYAMGDAAANLVWRGALAYLAVFYTDTLGISAAAAAILMLVVRISDGITDIIMGMIADRTTSKYGKFRPWIIWSAPVLALFMVLSFTVIPGLSPVAKIVWAYFTYIGLTLAYTVNNVPYSALMGVMTPSHTERTVLSGYRFAGAFCGGVLMMSFLPDMVEYFGQGNDAIGYQKTMYIFAGLLIILCGITFFTTKERVEPPTPSGSLKTELGDLLKNLPFIITPLLAITLFFYYRNLASGIFFAVVIGAAWFIIQQLIKKPESEITPSQRDLVDLLTNKPWIMILGLGLFTMLYNGVRYTTTAYYFTHYMGDKTLTGSFFLATMLTSIFAALIAGYLTTWLGKKTLFSISLAASGAFACAIFFVKPDQVTLIFALGICCEFFAAFMPVLVFSMLGDAADYSEWKNGRRATGLFYSAGTFIQKTGNGFASALVLLVLSAYGYIGSDPDTIANTKHVMVSLMSWIPALFSFVALGLLVVYPLNTKRMGEIEHDLESRRKAKA